MALWVEHNHGDRGAVFIAEQIRRLAAQGEYGGVTLWQHVAGRYAELSSPARGAQQAAYPSTPVDVSDAARGSRTAFVL